MTGVFKPQQKDGEKFGLISGMAPRGTWRLFVALNILLAVVAFYASQNTLRVRVEIIGDQATGSIDGVPVASLTLEDRIGDRYGLLARWQEYPQGWDDWRIRDVWSGEVLDADSFTGDELDAWETFHWSWDTSLLGTAETAIDLPSTLPPYAMALSPQSIDARDITLEATLTGGMSAGLVVAATDKGDGYAFIVRPRKTDCYWVPLQDGISLGPVPDSGSRLIPPYHHSLWNIVRVLAGSYLGMWGLFGIVGIICLSGAVGSLPIAGKLLAIRGWLLGWWEDQGEEGRRFTRRMAVLACVIVTFLVTRFVASIILERIPHVQDSIATLFQGRVFAAGALTAPVPEFIESLNFEMLVARDGHWYSKYTVGHSLVMVPFHWLERPWLLGPMAAVGAIPAVFLLGRLLWGFGTGMLGAALLTLSPFFLIMSGSHMSHTTTHFWLVWFHVAVVLTYQRRRWEWAAVAGVCLGMAGITRPFTGVLCGLPAIVPFALVAWEDRRRALKPALAFFLAALLPVSFQLGFNRYAIGDAFSFGYQEYSRADRLGFGDVGWLGGHSDLQGWHNTLLNLLELLPFLHGWPWWLGLSLVLAAVLLPGRGWWDGYLLAQWLALAGGYFFWWFHGIAYGPRFWYECTACLCLLSARGAVAMARWWQDRLELSPYPEEFRPLTPMFARGAVVVSLAVLTLGWTLPYLHHALQTEYRGYNFTTAAILNAVEEHGTTSALVLVEPDLFWSHFGVGFSQNDPWLRSDIIYAQIDEDVPIEDLVAAYPRDDVLIWDGEALREYR